MNASDSGQRYGMRYEVIPVYKLIVIKYLKDYIDSQYDLDLLFARFCELVSFMEEQGYVSEGIQAQPVGVGSGNHPCVCSAEQVHCPYVTD
jgi:hypothetical protein